MAIIKLQLGGLHCSRCEKSVKNALADVVREVQIDLTTQIAEIDSDETADKLIDSIEAIGFDAKEI
ncbi:heavy-metal-associated domain-containing protein [Ursidibacter arcticus]